MAAVEFRSTRKEDDFNWPFPPEKEVIEGANRPPGPVHLGEPAQNRLLVTLERLLTISTPDLKEALTEAADMVASALRADKVDVFLYEANLDALVAQGVSHTPVGHLQKELGLDVLYLQNGGRTVLNYLNKEPFLTGHAENDPDQLLGIIEGLGIRSIISAPLHVKGELRGVVEVTAQLPEAFSEYDLRFLGAVAGWVGTIMDRAELTRQVIHEATAEARRTTAEELVTIIAHDLRNYFTPLGGHLTMLQRRAAREHRPQDLEDLDAIEAIFKRFNVMINDLLDVGRLEHDSLALDRQPLDLVGLLREVAATFNSSDHPVTVQAPPQLFLEGDANRLRQLLENLLANALKFSPLQTPVELVASVEVSETGPLARLVVIDRGPGIDPQILNQLFKPYARSSRSKGVGLGLFLVKEIVQAHGGSFSVEPVPGGGTNFAILLPGVLDSVL